MKMMIALAVTVVLLQSVSSWWLIRTRPHHTETHINSDTTCHCHPRKFTRSVFYRALDADDNGHVDEREAATVLNQMDGPPTLEELENLMEHERRTVKTTTKVIKSKGCCVTTVHHSIIDNNNDGKVDKREAAKMLNLEEDHPGLQLFMHHADTKRDGMVDVEEFRDAVKDLLF